MADIIQLLPESIANQIAAGEVVQRPSSVVKELLENSIDAEASSIQLIIKDSGKTLIQVIDDGKGMSETDARMCFERHATSKIKNAQDLFSIKTMGFRGEAMPSIASISHLHLKTKQEGQELGTEIIIHGSTLKKQEYCQTPKGSSISVKNLFYNVPARRKFLKKDATEYNHILEEFKRVAIINPKISFQLIHNDNEIYHLPEGNLRQRITSIFGKSVNEKLVPIEEDTSVVKINGYIGRPELNKKTKSDQYLFVNGRYIKSPYLHHAIKNGYDNMLGDDEYPFYILDLEIDPATIDINIHPTKQEIKFEEDKLIYNYLKVTTKACLAKYSITPTLDFEKDLSFDRIYNETGYKQNDGAIKMHMPVEERRAKRKEIESWESMYREIQSDSDQEDGHITLPSTASLIEEESNASGVDLTASQPFQLHNQYIVNQIRSGFIVVDQQNAHERILYETYLKALEGQNMGVQQLLFPITVDFTPEKASTLETLCPELIKLGIKIEPFGHGSFVIHGVTAGMEESNFHAILEKVINQYLDNLELELGNNENLALSLAVHSSINRSKKLEVEEMQHMLDDLFATENPYTSPSGKKCFITYELDDIRKRFI